ncbi:hypothetical protein CFC21_013873, partial [Triticum aestivum]
AGSGRGGGGDEGPPG